jgi:hypothetical protein
MKGKKLYLLEIIISVRYQITFISILLFVGENVCKSKIAYVYVDIRGRYSLFTFKYNIVN